MANKINDGGAALYKNTATDAFPYGAIVKCNQCGYARELTLAYCAVAFRGFDEVPESKEPHIGIIYVDLRHKDLGVLRDVAYGIRSQFYDLDFQSLTKEELEGSGCTGWRYQVGDLSK